MAERASGGARAVAAQVARGHAIWLFAFGYFACYVPYSALTKVLSKGLAPGLGRPLSGVEILPVTVFASVLGTVAALSALRWWRHAHVFRAFGGSWPRPTARTLASGLCAAVIVVTTTLAYTFDGIGIVFAMVLMRGGVLVLAPLVDVLGGRRVRWGSWVALGLSVASLAVTLTDVKSYALTVVAALDIGAYLLAYFVRLRLMTQDAKSGDPERNRRFFVEEQMVATPAVLVALALLAVGLAPAETATQLRTGFLDLWSSPALGALLLVGLLSQGTGLFGGLILLQPQENAYCVPVNRASSVIAGVLATGALALLFAERPPAGSEWAGAGFILAAIAVLSVPAFQVRPRAGSGEAGTPGAGR